jgi:phosphopantetheinyl transferase
MNLWPAGIFRSLNELALRLGTAKRYRVFFRCWTRKKAYINGDGAGPYPAVDAFDVLVLAEQGTLIATRPDRRKAALDSVVRKTLHTENRVQRE